MRVKDTEKLDVAEHESTGVYLCQVSERVSCGACCGLYNVAGLSQSSLEGMLAERTADFAHVPRTVDGIEDFRKKIEGRAPRKRPFADFYHCPFLGLIGTNGKRVGCLLHPAGPGNDGKDWRGLSYYGGLACRTYFCPTTRHLPQTYLKILRQAMDHWYAFGLIVTEHLLLNAFFRHVEGRIGRPVEERDFTPVSGAAALIREFAGLKITWPYRRENAPGPCNYIFDNGEYPRPPVQRALRDIPQSRFEEIFIELDSGFSSEKDLCEAEELLTHLFNRLKKAIVCTKDDVKAAARVE